MAMNVRKNSDPFKKYWWVILVGFGFVGLWVCAPLMESGTGSGTVKQENGLQSNEQSLDSIHNPAGAPGSVVDLSMGGGAYGKKRNTEIKSFLYEASSTPESAAPGKAIRGSASPSASTLASALKRAAKKDSRGWGGKKARKGFKSPKASFRGLSGLGGSKGGSTGASSGGSRGAFGSKRANVGVTRTRGLAAAASADKDGGPSFMRALTRVAKTQQAAAKSGSGDIAAAAGQTSFDGKSSAYGTITSKGGGGVYGRLDDSAAPKNLKANSVATTESEFKPFSNVPDADDEGEEKDGGEDMKKMIIKMVIMAVVGGLVGGIVGGLMDSAFGSNLDTDKKDDKKTETSRKKISDQYAFYPYGRSYGTRIPEVA